MNPDFVVSFYGSIIYQIHTNSSYKTYCFESKLIPFSISETQIDIVYLYLWSQALCPDSARRHTPCYLYGYLPSDIVNNINLFTKNL